MQKFDFNDNWAFHKFGDEEHSIKVDLPHDAQILETRGEDYPSDSGYYPGGKYVYRKEFFLPVSEKNEMVFLEFDGVYMHAEVLVNGKQACYQPYGYTNFVVLAGEYLVPGKLNEITVIADNSQFPNSRWYTGAGIYRNVELYLGSEKHILPYGIKVNTLSYDPPRISISIDVSDKTDSEIDAEIYFGSEEKMKVTDFYSEVEIPNALLWSAEHPNLYTIRVRLLHAGEVVDFAEEKFGIRMVDCCAESGLRINGQAVLLRGGCIHHDNGLLGAAAFTDVEFRKVKKLKEAGFNAIRSAHNMCSKAILDACDFFGLYVMDEFADMWIQHKHKYDYATQFVDWYERDLSSMIRKDYNHPSVILYSIGNEVGESALPEGLEYARKLTDLVHALDRSRPVTCGINLLLNGLVSMGKGLYQGDGMVLEKDQKTNNKKDESGSTFVNSVMGKLGGVLNFVGRLKKFDQATKDVFEILDVAGYNYGSGRYDVDPKKYPQRVTIGSETFPPTLYKNWSAVKKHPNLIGDFMWTAWDYLGEAGLGLIGYSNDKRSARAYPTLLSGCGIIEITGEFKPEVYWAQQIWGLRHAPYLAVAPLTHAGEKAFPSMWRNSDTRHSWSWSGYEGLSTTVTVYSTGKTVELYHNDRKLGKRSVKECKAVFQRVIYLPGELKAIAYDSNGRVLGEDVLKSADSKLILAIKPENALFNEKELLYTAISLQDKSGIREFGKNGEITVSVNGGTLLALGNANPSPVYPYQGSNCDLFDGMAQAIIKPNKGSGEIKIKVSFNDQIFHEISVHKQI